MISKKMIGASIFVLLLLGSIGLASNATISNETASFEGSTEGTSNVTVNTTLNVSLAEQAYGLLLIIEKLSNYTSVIINVTLNVDNEILKEFNETEALREKAWDAYNSSNYQLAIKLAMDAMEGYRDIIKELMPEEEKIAKNETEEHEELVVEAQEELNRAREYLSYVEEILSEASQLGIDVSVFLELYNQTAKAYEKVEIDIDNGNLTTLKNDLETAEELKNRLSEAIEEELIPQMLSMKAEDIALTFMSKLNVQINKTIELMGIIENLTQVANVTYPPDYQEEIRDILQDYQGELQDIMAQVNELVKEGEYEEALELIKDLNDELKDIIKEIKEVQREFYKEYLKEYCEEYKEEDSEHTYYERYCEREEWEEEKEEHYENYNSTEEYEWEEEKENKEYDGNYTEKWDNEEKEHEDKNKEYEKNYTENWGKESGEYNSTRDDESDESPEEEDH